MKEMINIEFFRVTTREILIELNRRAEFHVRTNKFKDYSSRELIDYILKNRMNDFEK